MHVVREDDVHDLVELNGLLANVAFLAVITQQLLDLGYLLVDCCSALKGVYEYLFEVCFDVCLRIGFHNEDVHDLVAELVKGDLLLTHHLQLPLRCEHVLVKHSVAVAHGPRRACSQAALAADVRVRIRRLRSVGGPVALVQGCSWNDDNSNCCN